jgi:hypothetical protein
MANVGMLPDEVEFTGNWLKDDSEMTRETRSGGK